MQEKVTARLEDNIIRNITQVRAFNERWHGVFNNCFSDLWGNSERKRSVEKLENFSATP